MESEHYIGVVVIGRNEGERLKQCFQSLKRQVDNIIYVDSGSSDNSVKYAESIGVKVIKLDMSTPFSAGRARNEGFHYLTNDNRDIEYVQFLDGDCELRENWIAVAEKFLTENASYAIVAGRRKERFPERSIYNMLCDIEWNTPIGEAKSCGGDFMVRNSAFLEVEGFENSVIAGEEPELCYRLRKMRWQIYRLDHPMTLHDAEINSFTQWWKRCVRSGHAYAQGYSLHGAKSERYCMRDSLRIWFWALIMPGLIVFLAFVFSPWWLILSGIYLAYGVKIAVGINQRLANWKHSLYYAVFNILGKWPQLAGQILFINRRFIGQKYKIIEYR